MPTYDLLVSVYGFDSFGGVMWGYKDDIEKPEKIANKMGRKRYCVTDTYGAYTKSGLAQLLDAMSYKCRCPVCSKVSSPLELYSGAATRSDLDLLGARLKTHRLHVTHKEVKGVSGLIDASKYYDYLYNKKAAANELRGIISALE
jgi:queuine/archaeosine tRNA-ribosyltransferase